MHRPKPLLLVLALAAALLLPAGASAEPYSAVPGGGTGPARYDRTYIERFGSLRARKVLILVPGFIRGAGYFRPLARDLVRRSRDLQVWALDRRSNGLEDHSVLDEDDPQRSFDHYLRLQGFEPQDASTAPFARDWGMATALTDLRRVVLRARRGGRAVILGGHSFGASTAMTYAAWDFNGRGGYRDISGLVLLDGGNMATGRPSITVDQARERLAALQTGDPFTGLLPGLPPWAGGLFQTVGAQLARLDPHGLSPIQTYPLVPDSLRPPFPVTNLAAFGYARGRDTSPEGLRIIHLNSGRVAAAGDPRGWDDGGLTPMRRVAQADGTSRPTDGTEWYFPARLQLDGAAVAGLRPTPISQELGLRPLHLRRVDVPVYAFETAFARGRVLAGARRFARSSRVSYTRLVDRSRSYEHEDPVFAVPRRNDFLRTVVPFVDRIRR